MSKEGRDERFDWLEYVDELDEKEAKWIEQFYKEQYFREGSKIPMEDRIIQDKEHQKEADRLNNITRSDILFKAKKEGAMLNLENIDEDAVKFMEDMSDENDWLTAWKLHGFENALEVIHDQAKRDFSNGVQFHIVLLRYHEKRDRLRRVNNKDKRENKNAKK